MTNPVGSGAVRLLVTSRLLLISLVTLSVAASGLLLTSPEAAVAATGAHCSSTPFRSTPTKHVWFRIPALVQTNVGTLVAFAERRDTKDSDLGNFDVVSARSTDHGCSWSPYTVIGNDAGNRVSTPVPIVDTTTGDVLVMSVVTVIPGSGGTGKGLYLQTSSDDGVTFSPLLSDPIRPEGQYNGGLTGPGHGIQLSLTHPGRLIVPMGYRSASGKYGAYGIYSDDHGVSWHTGYQQQDTTGNADFLEGTIAELPSGDLFISYRLKHDLAKAGTARQYAISKDGGTSLSAPFKRLPLKIVSVQGSALSLTGVHNDELLFSAPAVTTANLRREMTIFVSKTQGATWSKQYQVELQDTPGSYSDLVQLDPDSVGVLYEAGIVTWKERIAFESVSLTQLNRPTLVASKLSYQRSAHPTKASTNARVMVSVTAKGAGSPPGRVTLSYAGKARTGRVWLDLTYSNRGSRMLTLPRLKPGTYRLTLTYSGTGRISKQTTPAGTLHVIG